MPRLDALTRIGLLRGLTSVAFEASTRAVWLATDLDLTEDGHAAFAEELAVCRDGAGDHEQLDRAARGVLVTGGDVRPAPSFRP